jgi:hypothetical protein
MKTRVKLTKPAATREQVYVFAHGCIERGEVECGEIRGHLFEWLQRPENVVAGHIKWTGYRTGSKPTIRIERHKPGAVIDHQLESAILVRRALHCTTHRRGESLRQIRTRSDTEDENVSGQRDKPVLRLRDADVCRSRL